ncbi:DUF4384 domain-containing protein [Alsobacter sp. KACC 23698]|uniref:DUF4384 domain-containing protein n=1 Tax=Alsobacter sp. KACC 23698 TaxID=3149229 RepID=A0AAU7JMG2_9HYPH
MLLATRSALILALLPAVFAAAGGSPNAAEAIRNRSVRIIEGDAAAGVGSAAPTATAPAEAPPDLPQGASRVGNPAGLRVELIPAADVALGTELAVRITADKPGYLVVVDVDSAGRLTQIYPNTHSLAQARGVTQKANFLAPGRPRIIPDKDDATQFKFVAAEPTGVGMVVAIHSDKPVQVIDLPDVPAMLAGRIRALQYLRESAQDLKILPVTEAEKIQDPIWSFAAKFYVIR